MYNQTEKKGLRCHICTGCGRCPGIYPDAAPVGMGGINPSEVGLRVVTDSFLTQEGKINGYVIAADIGTTTVAMVLYGPKGETIDRFVCVNPQTEYGADVISRIQAAEKKEHAIRMQQMIRGVLEQGETRFRKQASHCGDLRMVIAANTAMVYLLMGWDTGELGRAPFRAGRLGAVRTVIGQTACFIMPGLSAFVGGDIVSGIFACGLARGEKPSLLIDLGTNGEMALCGSRRIIACSSAAGPAFEGGVNKGIWGADMVSLTARLLEEKLLDETGLLAEPYFQTGILIGNVRVTQQSIRAIQLAKGAIAAGIGIIAQACGIHVSDIDRVVLSGGFGYYLDPADAVRIGLLPRDLLGKTVSGGNTALAGARLAGKILGCRQGEEMLLGELAVDIGRAEVLNLAEIPDFENRYMDAINFQ